MAQERGGEEETVMSKKLTELGVPILHMIREKDYLRGGSVAFLNEKTAVLVLLHLFIFL